MVDLASYDVIVANSSAGKDSQAMLDVLAERTGDLGIRDRLVVFHADLGRVEWEGTAELAEEHANHYGLRFIKIARPQGDILQHVAERGMFPDAARRWCTSDRRRWWNWVCSANTSGPCRRCTPTIVCSSWLEASDERACERHRAAA